MIAMLRIDIALKDNTCELNDAPAQGLGRPWPRWSYFDATAAELCRVVAAGVRFGPPNSDLRDRTETHTLKRDARKASHDDGPITPFAGGGP